MTVKIVRSCQKRLQIAPHRQCAWVGCHRQQATSPEGLQGAYGWLQAATQSPVTLIEDLMGIWVASKYEALAVGQQNWASLVGAVTPHKASVLSMERWGMQLLQLPLLPCVHAMWW